MAQLIACLLFFLCFSSKLISEETPFVTCDLGGQLGNQMCIIATTLAHAWDHNAEPIFPDLNKSSLNTDYNRDRIFFRLNSNPLPRPIKNVFHEIFDGGGFWKSPTIPYKPDQCLKGAFFCWKNFHHHREKILEAFAPSDEILDYLQKKYGWLLAQPKTVSVHVRTYNKALHEGQFPFAGLDYYERAMNLFPDDTIFVVFSDRINWCKHNFRRFKKSCVFAEGNDHIQDFFLISMLKGHILANSSYSWWAAYLDKNPNHKIIAPKYWYRIEPKLYHPSEKSYHFLPGWIVLDTNPHAKYPEDMKAYDKFSRSIDTQ